jgi:hypothetical protein
MIGEFIEKITAEVLHMIDQQIILFLRFWPIVTLFKHNWIFQ